jgi:hypothetical protein
MASLPIQRTNGGTVFSRRQREVRASGVTTSRFALLTHYDVEIPASTSAAPDDEIIVKLDEGAAEESIPGWVLPTAEAFAGILDLHSGWNSYGARPIDRRTVEVAGDLLAEVMNQSTPAPFVIPTVRGGVQLEWHRGGLDIEIAVNPGRPITIFAADSKSGDEFEGEWSRRDPSLASWIHKL